MTTYHFGTNRGDTPWCHAYFSNEAPYYGRTHCIKTDDSILEPNRYCPRCIEVYNKIHGKTRGMWDKQPLKLCSNELGRQCHTKAPEGRSCND